MGRSVVQRANMGMVEGGDGARLALEAFASLGILCDSTWQDLDRHSAIQPAIAGAIDLTHPTSPEQRFELIGAEPPPRERRRHVVVSILPSQ